MAHPAQNTASSFQNFGCPQISHRERKPLQCPEEAIICRQLKLDEHASKEGKEKTSEKDVDKDRLDTNVGPEETANDDPVSNAGMTDENTDLPHGIMTSDEDDELDALVNAAASAMAQPVEITRISQQATAEPCGLQSEIDQFRDQGYFDFTTENELYNSAKNKTTNRMSEGTKDVVVVQGPAPEVRKEKKIQRRPCTDGRWFNMQSMDLSKENKQDIQAIKLRNYIDPKRFYKVRRHCLSRLTLITIT